MEKNVKQYDTILFDLDGTLTDPKEGITKSVAYALSHFGIDVEDLDHLCKFIGPSLEYSFKEFYGLKGNDVAIAIQKYREVFSEVGILQNTEYLGMNLLLENLHKAGKRMIVATSKPTIYAKRILINFGIDRYFDIVMGSELNGERSDKGEVIAAALKESGVKSVDKCVMVGDRKYDIIGANENGMDSIGVLYGYGSFEELKDAGATYIAADIKQLSAILLG